MSLIDRIHDGLNGFVTILGLAGALYVAGSTISASMPQIAQDIERITRPMPPQTVVKYVEKDVGNPYVGKELYVRAIDDAAREEQMAGLESVANKGLQTLSDFGLKMIKRYESFSASVYKCPAGKDTIGYGHVVLPGEDFSKGVTEEEATELLRKDVARFESAVRENARTPLTQKQFDSAVGLTYNIGENAFENSTLLRLSNEGRHDEAAYEFSRWDKATVNGEKKSLRGLTRRRGGEEAIYLLGSMESDNSGNNGLGNSLDDTIIYERFDLSNN